MNTPFTSASLYVGDLHPEVNEATLFEVFREVGAVVSIRVCRHAITKHSLGYAYVNFQNPNDAERALDTHNYASIKDRPMRIMWSHRDPAIRKSGVGNVFIKNLDKTIDNKALYDAFSAFGSILSCKVVSDEKGESRGHGFVHFETQEAADLAIAKLNGMLLNDKKVFVGPFIRGRENTSSDRMFTNVYVKNVDESVTEDKFIEMFSSYGQITRGVLIRDENGKPRGFGFVNFAAPESAKAALAMKDAVVAGKSLWVGRAMKKAERHAELKKKFEQIRLDRLKFQGLNLYVKHIPDNVTDEMFQTEFAKFGSITSAKIMRDNNAASRGFGFVCFSTAEEAKEAFNRMNQASAVEGWNMRAPLYVAFAQRKDQRQAQLQAQFMNYPMMRGPGMAPMGMYPPPMMFQQRPAYGYAQQGMMRAPRGYPQQGAYQGMPYQGVPQQGTRPAPRPRRPQQAGGAPQQPGAAGSPVGQQGQRGNFQGMKLARNVRNPRNEMAPNVQQMFQGAAAQQAASAQQPHALMNLANASPEEQTQMIGQQLYHQVYAVDSVNAAKITGMLLEIERGEVLHLLDTPEALNAKIVEAQSVLANEATAAAQAAQ